MQLDEQENGAKMRQTQKSDECLLENSKNPDNSLWTLEDSDLIKSSQYFKRHSQCFQLFIYLLIIIIIIGSF